MSDKVQAYLKKIDQVIEAGPYRADWASLNEYPVPEWYKKAKFGIFIHWGVYSVPAFGSEWYPRLMYLEGTKEFEHHVKTYGPHKDFGYKDFIPMFRAEKFDPKEWARLFRESGAKYVMPVAEHHDGFQMYDSELSEWCASKMGPKRDVLGELKTEIEKEGMVFCASSHRAENYWFFAGSRTFDSGIEGEGMVEPYGFRDQAYASGDPQHMDTGVYSKPATKEHLQNWLARTCELVDKYQPKIVWFDWWIQNECFKPYLKKFAAYYYNRAAQWGVEVAINYKYEAYAYSTAVFDIERGQLSAIRPRFWQTDTAVAKNSWGYTENNQFKDPVDIVCDIIDIVSKNGAMLLNVGPRADGTITEEDQAVLRGIGSWLAVNGESIYDTTYWQVFGEGPTQVEDGAFTDTSRQPFTSKDIRFTYKAPYVYANVLVWPEDGKISIESLGSKKFSGVVRNVSLLGHDNKVTFRHEEGALEIQAEGKIESRYPVCLKVEID